MLFRSVTNLSLKVDNNFKIDNSNAMLIYGYGSDGMVSASKSIIKLVGEETKQYVQGYFQYDSKKSGGVTIGHLRFSKDKIKSTYYVDNPKLVVCTKDGYLDMYDMLSNIREKGIFLINTSMTDTELLAKLDTKFLQEKGVRIVSIDANKLAEELGLRNKISTIMQSCIIYLSKLVDFKMATEDMKKFAEKRYFKKGKEVLKANYRAIDEAINYMHQVKIVEPKAKTKTEVKHDLYDVINKRQGDDLPTSAFLNNKDGKFAAATARKDKRGVTDVVPKWNPTTCISCNQCSLYCPHGVIRPFLLNEEEYARAPKEIKDRCKEGKTPDIKGYYYFLATSAKDCLGCGVCLKNCPGKEALTWQSLSDALKNKEQAIFDYAVSKVSEKDVKGPLTFKSSQFATPKFEFSGACAGCGETPYLKLLTQLFGRHMIVANATGCTSIYSGSTPSMPYSLPWASSLFEDNAEYGYGMLLANKTIRTRIQKIIEENPGNPLLDKWAKNMDNYLICKDVYENLDYRTVPKEIRELKDYLVKRSIWTIGGDGWAYDIGYGGIDHILASNEDVNILVVDSQVYSNTGGQSSKSSPMGSIAAFTSFGKTQNKKDLAKVALAYPHVYVACVSMGANPNQVVKAFAEAEAHKGPSIVIAYSPCISHGIKGGLENSIAMEKLATTSGYFPIFRYNPNEAKKFTLDSKNVDFDKYEEFLNNQVRYNMLAVVNKEKAKALLKGNKAEAMERFAYYQRLDQEN